MANLLPQKGKRAVTVEYWTRVAVVWMFLLSGALLAVAILMVPTYVLITAQYEALSVRFNSMREQQETFAAFEKEVEAANTLARYVDQNDRTRSASALVDEIEAMSGETILITHYSFSQTESAIESVTIGGVAADRAALAAFRDALASDERFASAVLPISTLAADRDVPFSIVLTLHDE